MINIYSIIVGVYKPDSSLATNFQMLKGRCRLLVQVGYFWKLMVFLSFFDYYSFSQVETSVQFIILEMRN